MITSKEELYNTRVRANGRNAELVKLALGLGFTISRSSALPPMIGKFLYFHKKGCEIAASDSEQSFTSTSDFRELTVEEILDTTIEVGDIITRNTWPLEPKHDVVISIDGRNYYTKANRVISKKYNDIKIIKKHNQVENKYTVDKEFILAGHEAACQTWKTKIEEKFPELFPKKTYKYGDIFVDTEEGEEYLLSMVGQQKQMSLISIKGYDVGNRQKDPIKVTNHLAVTEEEIKQMAGSVYDSLELKQ